jgi:hypothetical protein
MGIFDKLFGQTKSEIIEPSMRFGRFSDSYKTDKKYDAWDEALELFEEKQYLESIRKFLFYLNSEEDGNVKISEENGTINFEILQGSKVITGVANDKKFKAESKIARSISPNIGLMRRLMDQNFALRYSKYAFDKDDNITMVFDTYLLDGSPYKLYYALKELAINTDKQDDVLIDEFKSLEPINTGHVKDVDPKIKEIKYQYIINEIKKAFDKVDNGKLNFDQYPGASSYIYLDLVYRLDYLVVPEGFTMETFEKIHHAFFANDGKPAGNKNSAIRKDLEELIKREKMDFFNEFYETTSTFGVTMPSGHESLTGFIDGEIGNMDWYQKNKHFDVALAIPGYIVGYSRFNNALPAPDKDYLHLFLRILENEYFKDLGYSREFINENGFIEKEIVQAIDEIKSIHSKKYPKINPDTKSLNFTNQVDFSKSYVLMVKNLDLTRLDRNTE